MWSDRFVLKYILAFVGLRPLASLCSQPLSPFSHAPYAWELFSKENTICGCQHHYLVKQGLKKKKHKSVGSNLTAQITTSFSSRVNKTKELMNEVIEKNGYLVHINRDMVGIKVNTWVIKLNNYLSNWQDVHMTEDTTTGWHEISAFKIKYT